MVKNHSTAVVKFLNSSRSCFPQYENLGLICVPQAYNYYFCSTHILHIIAGWKGGNNPKQPELITLLFMVDSGNSSWPSYFSSLSLQSPTFPPPHPASYAYLGDEHMIPGLQSQVSILKASVACEQVRYQDQANQESFLGNFPLKLKGKSLFSFCYNVGRVANGHSSQPSAGNLHDTEENKLQRRHQGESMSHLQRHVSFLMESYSPSEQ